MTVTLSPRLTRPIRLLPSARADRSRPRARSRPPTVTVRELDAGELDVLDAVFAGLSPASRRLRFHAATPRLSSRTRHQLAAVDGHHHIAVAAFAPSGEPIGIARLVGLDARHAELAIEVVDAWHGRGVGRRLVLAVVERGRAEGYTRLVADVLSENTPMRRLLASVLPIVGSVRDGVETTLTADLRPAEITRHSTTAALAA